MIKSFLRSFFDSDLKVSILLLVIAILSYWEISMLQYSVQYDMLDVVLPWRFHAGECLRHNIFPFWNPYQSTGYPIHADLQCPTFYPETFIIGSVFGYSNITLHFLFIVYVFLAGLGMFKLLRHFGAISIAAFITGAAFMLSGVFVSHVQHLFAIIGFTWIPWVLLYYLRMSEDPWNFRHILPLSLFSFLMISGGYQALSIIMIYLMAILFLYYIVRSLVMKNRAVAIRLVLSNLTLMGLLLLLTAVILVSTLNVFDYVERFSGLSTEQAMTNPFTPRSLISFIAPFGVVKHEDYLKTDLSMSNIYIGIIMLIFFLAGLFKKHRGGIYVMLGFGIISLLAAFGEILPVRMLLFKYVPTMDLFRLPSYFRFFMVIPIFIIAGITLSDLMTHREKYSRRFGFSFFLVGMGTLALFGWSTAQISGNEFVFLDPSLTIAEKLEQAPIFEHILFHTLLNLVILIVSFLLYYYKVLNMRVLFSTFIILEMFIALQLNITYTGCSPEWHPVKIRSQLKMFPKGFPLPPGQNIASNTDKANTFQPFWRNVNIFNKTVSYDCFTSFKFDGYKQLEDSLPELKNAILQNTLVYLSDEIFPESEMAGRTGSAISPHTLFIPEDVFESVDRQVIRSDSTDNIILTGFSPGSVSARVTTRYKQVLTLMQSDYKGWEVLVDGKSVPHFISNKLYISAILDPGERQVDFKYRNDPVKAAFVVSFSMFLLILFLITRQHIMKRYNGSRWRLYLISLVTVLFIIIFKLISMNRARQDIRIYEKMVDRAVQLELSDPGHTDYIFAVDDPLALMKSIEKAGADLNFDLYRHSTPENISLISENLGSKTGDNLFYAGINTRKRHELLPVLQSHFQGIKTFEKKTNSELIILDKKESPDTAWVYAIDTDFEATDTNWFGYERNLDTAVVYSGRYSNKLTAAEPYSYTLIIPASAATGNNPIFHLSAAVNRDEGNEAYLVLEFRRKGSNIGYYTLGIHEAVRKTNAWSHVYFSTGTNLRLLPGDEIRLYVWNDSDADLWVDDISVKIGANKYY